MTCNKCNPESPKIPAKYSSYAAVFEAEAMPQYTVRLARGTAYAANEGGLLGNYTWRLRWLHPDEGNDAPAWIKQYKRSGNYAGWEQAARRFKVGDKVVATASAGARFAFPAYGVVKSDDNCGSYPYYVQFAALKANDRHHSNVALWCAEKDMEAVND